MKYVVDDGFSHYSYKRLWPFVVKRYERPDVYGTIVAATVDEDAAMAAVRLMETKGADDHVADSTPQEKAVAG